MQASVDGGLMPALSKSRKYISGAPMSATQLTALTRELFTQLNNVDEEFPKSFSSHSCKIGTSISDRRVHGGHAKLGDRTPLEYSREALAGPLYALEHAIAAVRLGWFDPDATRSGRWQQHHDPESLKGALNLGSAGQTHLHHVSSD